MIRRFIKPAYSHAPWKNPKYPPSCMCKGKSSPVKVLGGKVSTADKTQKEKTRTTTVAAAATTTMNSYQRHRHELQRHRASRTSPVTGWNMFPLIEGFTTFWRILK